MSVAPKTVLDRHSEYQRICRDLFGLFGRAKQARSQCDGLGLTAPYPTTGAGPAMVGVEFPLAGDLSHVTSAADLASVVKSLEAMEAALVTPIQVDGVTVLPIAALAKFAG